MITLSKEIKKLIDYFESINYVSPWLELGESNLDSIINICPVVTIKKGDALFHQGYKNKYAYIIRKGRLRISFVDSGGNERCIYIAEKGSMIGEETLLDNKPSYASAFAIVDTSLYKIGLNDLISVLEQDPLLSISIMKLMSKKIRLLNSEIKYFSKNAVSRVAITLVSLCIQYGQEHREGIRISIYFTHEELADLTNLNRVTVTKSYGYLRDKGIIGMNSGYMIIKDAEKLIQIID